MAALGGDFARVESAAGEVFRANVDRLLGAMAGRLPGDSAEERATLAASIFAEMMGALLVSRALTDRGASNRLLAAARDNLKARIGA